MSETKETPRLEINTSRQFESWLREQNINLAFTTYQVGKIFFLGTRRPQAKKLFVFERTLKRCMGLAVFENSLYTSSLYQIHRFEDVQNDHDNTPGSKTFGKRIYVPQLNYITGDLDTHEMAVETNNGSNRLVFVNTLFNCLATVSEKFSFKPVWRPPFISKLAAEDRCHLNGLALREGEARYVSAVSTTDVVNGWREHRDNGGIVMDIKTNETIAENLSMPHSPRWHNETLYLSNAGSGHFGRIDMKSGKFEEIAFCPGFLRGMAIHNGFAIVGISKCRKNRTFQGIALDENLKNKKVEPRCGLLVIDLKTGDIVHSLTIEGIIDEIFDVAVIPETVKTQAIGFKTDEIRRVISIDTDENG